MGFPNLLILEFDSLTKGCVQNNHVICQIIWFISKGIILNRSTTGRDRIYLDFVGYCVAKTGTLP